MTNEELLKLEDQIREHKSKGQTSNVVLKIAQVERLIDAAKSALPKAEVFDFNIAAEVRRDEIQQRRYNEKWANYTRKLRFEKQEKERLEKRRLRREELIAKWNNFSGSQQKLNQS